MGVIVGGTGVDVAVGVGVRGAVQGNDGASSVLGELGLLSCCGTRVSVGLAGVLVAVVDIPTEGSVVLCISVGTGDAWFAEAPIFGHMTKPNRSTATSATRNAGSTRDASGLDAAYSTTGCRITRTVLLS
jgi:hypothetical protein